MRGRGIRAFAAVLATVALGVGPADAATRYAAPGGTGLAPCEEAADPCPLHTAAEGSSGDIVEMAPGIYSDTEGDLGYTGYVNLLGVTVRGEPGKARPLIRVDVNEHTWGAFFVGPHAAVSDLEIENAAVIGGALTVQDGTVEDVIARSPASDRFTCDFFSGTLRNSVCLNGAGGAAIGTNVRPFEPSLITIRNSTAIAEGPGSVGASFSYHAAKPGIVAEIDAKGLIARGQAKDVFAGAFEYSGGYGATTDVTLSHSDYATVETETSGPSSASITPAGTNGNLIAAPLLAADHFHQLPGSPTIDAGEVDAESAATDIDGQARTIGPAPDIGADELEEPPPVLAAAAPGGGGGGGDLSLPPGTWLKRHPSKRTAKRLAQFRFASSEAGSRFECRLDRKRFSACSSPFLRKVIAGPHSFEVRAVGPEGEIDSTPAVFRWRVLKR